MEVNEEKTKTTHTFIIPDISFHLIFCFLSLHELTLISCCNQQWRKLTTDPLFLNMFCHNDSFQLTDKERLIGVCRSPFRQVIRSMSKPALPKVIGLNDLFNTTIHRFPRLTTLEIGQIEYDHHTTQEILNIRLPNKNNLKHLKLCLFYIEVDLSDYSFFYIIINSLETLQISGSFRKSQSDALVKIVRNLPCLKRLDIGTSKYNTPSSLMLIEMNRDIIAKLCAHPGEPQNLKEICAWFKIEEREERECERLLCQLPNLKHIDCIIDVDTRISTSLSRWLRTLRFEIGHPDLNDSEVSKIIQFPHLSHIYLLNCRFTLNYFELKPPYFKSDVPLQRMISGVSSNLQTLLIAGRNFGSENRISFEVLSSCQKLQSLALFDVTLNTEKFDLLLKCNQLRFINLINCNGFDLSDASDVMNLALKVPSNSFPYLEKVQIDSSRNKMTADELYFD
jgi:hypothetical protein